MRGKRILILFYLFIIIATVCYASEVELKVTGELKEKVNINIKMSVNLAELEENIYFLQGQLEYDTNIFEKVTAKDIEPLNGWHDLVFNEENGMFIIEGLENQEIDIQDIMNIKMRTKSKLTKDTTSIKLKNIKELGENQTENELEDVVVTVSKPATSDFANFANKILPFTGENSFITYGIIIGISLIVIVFISNKRKHKTK